MNHKALLQLGSELMHEFRHGNLPADRAMAEYVRTRRFLGAGDKHFLSDIYYYTIRHLRRIDEAILSAFGNTVAGERRFSAGFPVSVELGAKPWMRKPATGKKQKIERQARYDRLVDTIRLGLAAVELELDPPMMVAEEITRTWPKPAEGRFPMKVETLERIVTRAAEVMELYKSPRKPTEYERAYSFPGWLWSQLAEGRGIDDLEHLAQSLNKQGPVALRVNTLVTSVEAAESALKEKGIVYTRGEFSPTAFVLKERVSRAAIPNLNDGWFEIQDEGSQMVSLYASPTAGMRIADTCAGSGGKALHLAALMNNEGVIYAFDSEKARIANLPKRTVRNKASIVDCTIPLGPADTPPTDEKLEPLDMVLIDAPCSGTGTLRRNPDAKWRLSPTTLEEIRLTQRDILDNWAKKVKPGGFLVYITCSLLASENELQIDDFLRRNPNFEFAPPENFPVKLTERGEMVLRPDIHGCDGFYAVRLRNKP